MEPELTEDQKPIGKLVNDFKVVLKDANYRTVRTLELPHDTEIAKEDIVRIGLWVVGNMGVTANG